MYKYSSDKAALEGDVTGTYIEKVSKSTSFHYGNVVLFFFILYLALGNASRIGQFLPTGGYPVAELLLYVAVFPLYLLDKIRLPRPLWLVIFFFSISWILGWIQNIDELGIAEVGLALGYVLRLVGILLVTNYIGFLFHRKFSPLKIIHLFLCLASVQVFIGLVFYVIFPQAEVMWSLLARYGIVFYGDPHVKRLVGPVFDPNFFGNLLVLPATIALAQLTLMRKRRKIYFAYFLLFVVAILLTVSRSSLIGFGMSILTLAFLMLRKDPILYFRFLVRGSVLLGVIVLGMFAFSQVPERLVERLTTLAQDPSAQHRVVSFVGGVSYLLDPVHMLVGLGYNFIPFVVDKEYIVTNFDASLLNLIIALGIPLSLVVFLCLTRWLLFSFKGLKLVNFTLYVSLSTYLIASIIMSFFNNLLFYPFYLLTVLPLLAYGYWEGRENRV